MPVKRSLFTKYFDGENFPQFHCSRCGTGSLISTEKIQELEPAFSRVKHGDDAWDPDWISLRIAVRLTCDNSACGEYHVAYATGGIEHGYSEQGEMEYYSLLKIRSVVPSPKLIEVHENTPEAVARQIETAMNAFWVDNRLSANALRSSLEILLDELGVVQKPRLADRISEHKKSNPQDADKFDALRYIGNLGSHGQNVSDEALFDAFDIYEFFLKELYDDTKDKVAKMVSKMISQKGNY